MSFASQYELIATIIKADRYIVEVDEHGVGDLLTSLLRVCHDYSDSRLDAEDLGSQIASIILGWTSEGNLVLWPEEEGSGPADWDELDKPKGVGQTDTLSAPDGTHDTRTLPPLDGGGL